MRGCWHGSREFEAVTELDLLSLGRAASDDIVTEFGQIVTITFAMVIGIFYFLNQAKLGLKVFAYLIYSIGMFLYFGVMVVNTNVVLGVKEGLEALPPDHLSRPTLHYLAVNNSWVHVVESTLMTGGFLVLGLFFARKADHEPAAERMKLVSRGDAEGAE